MAYINGEIWANVWFTHYIVSINPVTGDVVRWMDLTDMEEEDEYKSWEKGDVLNGITVVDNKLFVTGKNWKNIY